MQNQSYRVVLDTNQVVGAGTSWLVNGCPSPDPNTNRRVLILVAERHEGLYCQGILEEYLEKLIERQHPPARIAKLITYLIGAFRSVTVTSASAPVQPTDADDEVFLLCALDGKADYLVSEDHALLALRPNYTRPVIGKSVELAPVLGA